MEMGRSARVIGFMAAVIIILQIIIAVGVWLPSKRAPRERFEYAVLWQLNSGKNPWFSPLDVSIPEGVSDGDMLKRMGENGWDLVGLDHPPHEERQWIFRRAILDKSSAI